MKKYVTAAVAIATVITLSGCVPVRTPKNPGTSSSSEITSSGNNTSEPTSPAEESPKVQNPGDTITLGNWEITVNSASVSELIEGDHNIGFKPDEGNKYVVVNTTVKNIGTESDTFLPNFSVGGDIRARMNHGEYEFKATTLLGNDDDLHNANLNPLSSKTGIIVFSIADEAAIIDELTITFSLKDEKVTYSLK